MEKELGISRGKGVVHKETLRKGKISRSPRGASTGTGRKQEAVLIIGECKTSREGGREIQTGGRGDRARGCRLGHQKKD